MSQVIFLGQVYLIVIIITAYGRKREAAGVARVVYEH
jgi:hypothetical protein